MHRDNICERTCADLRKVLSAQVKQCSHKMYGGNKHTVNVYIGWQTFLSKLDNLVATSLVPRFSAAGAASDVLPTTEPKASRGGRSGG